MGGYASPKRVGCLETRTHSALVGLLLLFPTCLLCWWWVLQPLISWCCYVCGVRFPERGRLTVWPRFEPLWMDSCFSFIFFLCVFRSCNLVQIVLDLIPFLSCVAKALRAARRRNMPKNQTVVAHLLPFSSFLRHPPLYFAGV